VQRTLIAQRALARFMQRRYVCDEHIKGRLSDEMIAITAIARQFLRRTTWSLAGSGCGKTNVVNTGVSKMHFADYLDAVVCGGFLRNARRFCDGSVRRRTVSSYR
jgi:hypothetical protein